MNISTIGDRLAIETEDGRITLSAEEVAKLIVNARQILGRLASASPEEGQYRPVPSIRATGLKASLDAHHSSVVLAVRREDDQDDAYVLSVEAAKGLAEDILDLVKQVAAEGPAKLQ
ncbi:MAG: hypothetical protein H6R00_742 [Proteobacteria bacterium]|nr:hypothetical protein [Pseudomonadota bacterium]